MFAPPFYIPLHTPPCPSLPRQERLLFCPSNSAVIDNVLLNFPDPVTSRNAANAVRVKVELPPVFQHMRTNTLSESTKLVSHGSKEVFIYKTFLIDPYVRQRGTHIASRIMVRGVIFGYL